METCGELVVRFLCGKEMKALGACSRHLHLVCNQHAEFVCRTKTGKIVTLLENESFGDFLEFLEQFDKEDISMKQMIMERERSSISRSKLSLMHSMLSRRVVKISVGDLHGGFVTNSGELYMMGDNADGQLGVGDVENRPTPFKVRESVYSVGCGRYHTVIVDTVGDLHSSGFGLYGQLGNQSHESLSVLTRVTSDHQFVAVTCGMFSSYATTKLGEVYSCGKGDSGNLGLCHRENVYEFSRIKSLKDCRIRLVSAGTAHTLFLTSKGGVYSTGDGRFGQLGSSQPSIVAPHPLPINEYITNINCDLDYSVVTNRHKESHIYGKFGAES